MKDTAWCCEKTVGRFEVLRQTQLERQKRVDVSDELGGIRDLPEPALEPERA